MVLKRFRIGGLGRSFDEDKGEVIGGECLGLGLLSLVVVPGILDVELLVWRLDGQDNMSGGFEGEEGAMRSMVRQTFAWSHEWCYRTQSHRESFIGASYVLADISPNSIEI